MQCTRHAQLLDATGARGLIPLVFADIDLASIPPPIPSNLPLFINIGLTDSDFNAKPALAAWDALHARRLTPQAQTRAAWRLRIRRLR